MRNNWLVIRIIIIIMCNNWLVIRIIIMRNNWLVIGTTIESPYMGPREIHCGRLTPIHMQGGEDAVSMWKY